MAHRKLRPWMRCLPLLPVCLAAVLVGGGILEAQGGPNIQVRDGTTVIPQNSSVDFDSTPVGVASSKTFTVANTGDANLRVSEAISVPLGFTLTASFPDIPDGRGLATNLNTTDTTINGVPFSTLAPGVSATFTVALNSGTGGAKSGPVSFTSNVTGRTTVLFNVTGTVTGNGGGGGGTTQYIDDNDAGFTVTAGWFPNYTEVGPSGRSPWRGFLTWANPGTGTAMANWTFSGLQAGQQYRISATWVGYPWGATNTPFRVFDGTTNLTPTPIRVNQQVDSTGFTDNGAVWQNLGTFTPSGSTLRVQMADDANSYPNADGVRCEPVTGGGGTAQTKNDQPLDAVTGTWVPAFTGADHGDFQEGVTYAEPSAGAPTATAYLRFTGLTPGNTYRFLVGFNAFSWAATNTPFEVWDGDNTLVTTVRVNQTVTPTDASDSGVGWKLLGTFTLANNTAWIGVRNDANSWPFLDAARVESGGGGGGGGPSVADTVRFLNQATWGPTPALIGQVQATGFSAWLDQQFAAPASSYPTLILFNNNNNVAPSGTPVTYYPFSCYGDPAVSGNPARAACIRDNYSMYPLQTRFFTNALYEPDQLRQRTAWALHKIWVTSGADLTQPSWVAPYLQILDNNAFGNFRTLMSQVTLNPGMGNYLDMANSTRVNANENYPRELLQLFTIGLDELNPDGTPKLDAGNNKIPTYDQALINELTKVYTGWRLAPQAGAGRPNYIDPMRLNGAAAENPANHDFTQKFLLRGYVQPARTSNVTNAYLDLNESLDNIYQNPNVGPFICKQLIQQLVTSNPSPAYVARVVDVFNRNKTSPNQLREVVRAILLDPEARGDLKTTDNYGRLKEPVQFITNLMRMFDARSDNRTTNSDGYLTTYPPNGNDVFAGGLGQDPWRPPTVFSYFPPDNVAVPPNPPSTPEAVLGPEFQILTTSTVLRRANFVNQWAFFAFGTGLARERVRAPITTPNGTYPTAPPGHPQAGEAITPTGNLGTSVSVDFLLPLAGDPGGLADELNRLMLNGSMTPEMKSQIVNAVNAVAGSNPRKRVRTAVYLVVTSQQYQVQR